MVEILVGEIGLDCLFDLLFVEAADRLADVENDAGGIAVPDIYVDEHGDERLVADTSHTCDGDTAQELEAVVGGQHQRLLVFGAVERLEQPEGVVTHDAVRRLGALVEQDGEQLRVVVFPKPDHRQVLDVGYGIVELSEPEAVVALQRHRIDVEFGMGGLEAVGRVADHVRLEDVDVLGPGADAQPFAQQSQQVESRLVLKHVDAVGERRDAASRSHDVVSCDEIVLAVVAVVAGVEDHEAGIRGDGFDLFEDDARAQVGDRVETSISAPRPGCTTWNRVLSPRRVWRPIPGRCRDGGPVRAGCAASRRRHLRPIPHRASPKGTAGGAFRVRGRPSCPRRRGGPRG